MRLAALITSSIAVCGLILLAGVLRCVRTGMRRRHWYCIACILWGASLWGQDSPRIATPSYWTAVGVAAGSAAFDAGTTLTMLHGYCNVEGNTPWLYGAHPTAARTLPIMAGEVALASFASYEIKKHRGMRRVWFVPLAYVSAVHLEGAAQNLAKCR